MHSEVCACCGNTVAEHYVDREQLSGVKRLAAASVTEQTYGITRRQKVLETTTAVSDLVLHQFTLCEACVRERVRSCERHRLQHRVDDAAAPSPKPHKLWVDLTVVPAILAAVAVVTWRMSIGWIHWVALGVVPVWIALMLVGEQSLKHKAATPPAPPDADLDALPFAALVAREATQRDLVGLDEAIVRDPVTDRAAVTALERVQVTAPPERTEVLRRATSPDATIAAIRLTVAGKS